eukprot:6196160-Pleurochrysis_carterae.AAC.1
MCGCASHVRTTLGRVDGGSKAWRAQLSRPQQSSERPSIAIISIPYDRHRQHGVSLSSSSSSSSSSS